MAVTCYYSGRFGNIFLAAANMIAYAKKHNLTFYSPLEADAYKGFTGDNKVPFHIPSTGAKPINPRVYQEPCMAEGTPRYHEIPYMDNVLLDGYFQSFKYFDWCRDSIIETFGFPYKMNEGIVSVSVRRGDCLEAPDKFPVAPKEYYHNAIEYMQSKGYNDFKVFGDDLLWSKEEFTLSNYPNANFTFSEGQSEMESYLGIQNCEHNITARSTFSLTAAWMNRNPNKIVLVPTIRHKWWRSMNADLLTDTNFVQIDFQNLSDE